MVEHTRLIIISSLVIAVVVLVVGGCFVGGAGFLFARSGLQLVANQVREDIQINPVISGQTVDLSPDSVPCAGGAASPARSGNRTRARVRCWP